MVLLLLFLTLSTPANIRKQRTKPKSIKGFTIKLVKKKNIYLPSHNANECIGQLNQ